ncbi:hypothetical protein Vafri_21009 [Volvox africanus]|uniref:Protein kinase domain-containing protein n=1 Tax=Volvox africanus TaxID=51714 RepID=A0A8J4BRY0_9CHLO|nr:hypothetical protein Vafri_21009 [Volvox africanus]
MMQPVSIASTGGKSDGKRSGSGSGKQLHECRVLSKVASQVVQQSRASASSGRGGSSISSRRASSHRTSNRAKPQDQQQDAATSYVTTETGSGVHGGGGGGDGAVPAETCFANLSYIYPEELSLLQDELGSGTGGKVFKCKYGITDVAIKVFDINYLENNNEADITEIQHGGIHFQTHAGSHQCKDLRRGRQREGRSMVTPDIYN